jgi:hypothetical protein
MAGHGDHVKTTYKVIGRSFRDHQTGEEFEADLDPDQERRAKARGQIRVVKRHDENPKPERQEAEDV